MVESPQGPADDQGPADHEVDRYPTLEDVLGRVLDSDEIAGVTVDRVEITCFANGEANCRWFAPRADESDFIHLNP